MEADRVVAQGHQAEQTWTSLGFTEQKLAPGSYRVSVEVKDSTKKHHQVATSTFVLTIS